MTRVSAGKAVRARLDAELAHAEREEGRPLEWSSRELLVIEAAMQAADRAAELRRLWRAEIAPARSRVPAR